LLNLTTGYLLVSHGSRDPRPQAAIAALASGLTKILAYPVGWATLEFGQESLASQIQQFARTQRVKLIYVVPLFLSSGVHVCDDIPEQIAIARSGLAREVSPPDVRLTPFQRSHPASGLIAVPHLGNTIDFASSAWERMQQHPEVDAWITVAHGSRRLGGNAEIEAVATRIQANMSHPHRLAYWSIEGQLAAQIQDLLASGYRTIGLLPHFLFPGRLTDAIAATIQTLAEQVSDATFICLKTWGEADEWTPNLVDWLMRTTQSELPGLSMPDCLAPTTTRANP
jgi:sirohydrochlorin cobaltochelatase